MNIPRFAGAAALGAAAVLTLAGCIQLPSPQAPTTTTPTTTTPTTTEPATPSGDGLVDTQWSGSAIGSDDIGIDVTFTFESDGTLYITQWNDETGVPFDDASDTWSMDGSTLELTLSNIEDIERIDFTGTYSGSSPIEMTGTDGVGGSGYTLTLTQG